MSFRAKMAVKQHSKARHWAFHVLLELADYYGPNSLIFPSLPTLAREMRIDIKTVRAAIVTLSELGEITVTPRPGQSYLFKINLPGADLPNGTPTENGMGKTTPTKNGMGAKPTPTGNGRTTPTENGRPTPTGNGSLTQEVTQEVTLSPADAATYVFSVGLELLVETGSSEKSARTFLGMQVRDYGIEQVKTAIDEALRQGAGEPKAYLIKTLHGMRKRQPAMSAQRRRSNSI